MNTITQESSASCTKASINSSVADASKASAMMPGVVGDRFADDLSSQTSVSRGEGCSDNGGGVGARSSTSLIKRQTREMQQRQQQPRRSNDKQTLCILHA